MGDPREIAVSDLSRVILCLIASRFEHRTLWVYIEQLNHSAIAAQNAKDQLLDALQQGYPYDYCETDKKKRRMINLFRVYKIATIEIPFDAVYHNMLNHFIYP